MTTKTYSEVVELKTTDLDEQTLIVDDGAYKWLVDRTIYEAAMENPVAHDRTGEDEAEANYYSDFCNLCPSLDRFDPARAKAAKAKFRDIYGHEPNWA